jgi:hypothetical protein
MAEHDGTRLAAEYDSWCNVRVKESDQRDQLSIEFELGMYELGRSLYPRNLRVLDGLVLSYSAAGRHRESLLAALELIGHEPQNPRHHYNYACGLSRTGELLPALRALRDAVQLGFADFEFMASDPDLDALRELPEFVQFQEFAVKRARQA